MTRLLAPFVLVVSLTAASDVLSVIKPNRSAGLSAQLGVPFDGRFSATNVTIAALIAAAYGGTTPLDARRISGLPSWAARDRFDVEARAERPEPVEDSEDDAAIFAAFGMVRTLLADRLVLRVHEGSRVEPVYALVRAGRLQPSSIEPTGRDCDAFAKAGPFVEAPPGPDGRPLPPCGVRVRRGEMVASGGTLAVLARRLSVLAGVEREVIDMTNDARRYDFTLQWVPPQAPAEHDTAADSGPSLFTALQEQLGLRLESRRAPVRVLVVDRIERPTAN
jgi:uncharacterized protein (TIGR03435 family)